MIKQEVINKVKLLQGIKDAGKDEVLNLFFDLVIDEIKEYIGVEIALEKISISLIIKMLNFKYSRSGTETLSSYNYSGVSETFLQGYPEDILISLNSLKRLYSNSKKVRFI